MCRFRCTPPGSPPYRVTVVDGSFDEVWFEVHSNSFPNNDECPVAAVFVNGTDLRVVVNRAQGHRQEVFDHAFLPVNSRPSPASLWGSSSGPPARRGERREPWVAPDGRVAVLTCTCGDFGCGGIAARITSEGEVVTWSDLSHPFSTEVLPIGPMRFRRDQYNRALADVDGPK